MPIKEAAGHIKKAGCGRGGPKAQERFRISGCEDKPVRNKKNQYMLGIWVRDNAQGLGTVTFLNTDSRFGALGHGIHDTDTNTLMEIKDGRVYETSIRSIQKGAGGNRAG